jgi:gliding motility-associated lipoprotein GldH
MRLFIVVFVVLLAVFAASCKSKALYEVEKPVVATGWAYLDTLDFAFDITDTSKRYQMELSVIWADSFKHQNLYLKLGTIFAGGDKYKQVVRSYDLYDTDGKPIGTKSSGKYTTPFVLQETTQFKTAGTYHFTVAQNTRDSILMGVAGIKLKVE